MDGSLHQRPKPEEPRCAQRTVGPHVLVSADAYFPIAVGPLTPRTPPIKILDFGRLKNSFSTHFPNYTSSFSPQKLSHEGSNEFAVINRKI